jgi:uncharacterized membrane protein YidH (DUF202 family)
VSRSLGNPENKTGGSTRPEKLIEAGPPPLPEVAQTDPLASIIYAQYRTELANLRTDLAEHRTSLAEFRTDLSTDRTDMAKRRTGMSFQRTRMASERTLMSFIRTSLSLIGFGFTIFQTFRALFEAGLLTNSEAPLNFGLTLVGLGIFILAVGIAYHIQFMIGLRGERDAMIGDDLIHGESKFPPSVTLVTACFLLGFGLFLIVSMIFHFGPFA